MHMRTAVHILVSNTVETKFIDIQLHALKVFAVIFKLAIAIASGNSGRKVTYVYCSIFAH